MVDFAIIGGGIIGSAIARELAKRKVGSVHVLEKEASLGCHASGRNSGVIHSGINQKPGSLKARMCVEGSRRLREFCGRHHVPMCDCGTLVTARTPAEVDVLEQVKRLGAACGVPDLQMLTAAQLKEKEPLAKGIAALFSPTGATVDSLALLNAVADDAQSMGVEYRLNSGVTAIEDRTIQTSTGRIRANYIINCAGLHADRIAHMMNIGRSYRIIPFRGEYWQVRGCKIQGMVYQPPNLRFPFLNIHLTRETDGRVLAGPNAVLALGREAYEKQWVWKEIPGILASRQFLRLLVRPEFLRLACQNLKTCLSQSAFFEQISSLVSNVRMEDLKPYRSGIRAQLVDSAGRMVNDILVERTPLSTHILNAVSPGMTCSLAFAEHIVNDLLSGEGLGHGKPPSVPLFRRGMEQEKLPVV